jgi:FkbM family methyltransferase
MTPTKASFSHNFFSNIKKIIDRGFFYTTKIELYKIIFDEKYINSKLRRYLLKIITLLAKKTKLSQPKFIKKILDNEIESYSQLKQDIFVLTMLSNKSNGYFIEVGAGDGINFSNTYLLEKNFNWNGILIEPNKTFYEACLESRKCKIVNKLLLNRENQKVRFYEKNIGEFSHSEGFGNLSASEVKSEYEVETIKFEEIFNDSNLTLEIDFLSIDTEGSESEILQSIDFSQFKPTVICIEHNYDKRNRIFFLKYLSKKGYKLIYPGISRWDSWFILQS